MLKWHLDAFAIHGTIFFYISWLDIVFNKKTNYYEKVSRGSLIRTRLVYLYQLEAFLLEVLYASPFALNLLLLMLKVF